MLVVRMMVIHSVQEVSLLFDVLVLVIKAT